MATTNPCWGSSSRKPPEFSVLRHNGFCAVAMVDIDVNDRHLGHESMGYAATPSEHWMVFFLMGNPKQKWMMIGGYLQLRKAP